MKKKILIIEDDQAIRSNILDLVDASGASLAEWNGKKLAALPRTAIRNVYPYVWAAQFKTERIGFSGRTGARATITLPPPSIVNAGAGVPQADTSQVGPPYELVLEAINGVTWQAKTKAR